MFFGRRSRGSCGTCRCSAALHAGVEEEPERPALRDDLLHRRDRGRLPVAGGARRETRGRAGSAARRGGRRTSRPRPAGELRDGDSSGHASQAPPAGGGAREERGGDPRGAAGKPAGGRRGTGRFGAARRPDRGARYDQVAVLAKRQARSTNPAYRPPRRRARGGPARCRGRRGPGRGRRPRRRRRRRRRAGPRTARRQAHRAPRPR